MGNKRDTLKLELSDGFVIKILLILVSFYLFVKYWDSLINISLIILLAYIFSVGLKPTINLLEKKLPKKQSIAIVYIVCFLITLGALSFIILPIINELSGIVSDMDRYLMEFIQKYPVANNLMSNFGIDVSQGDITQRIFVFFGQNNFVQQGFNIANGFVSMLIVLGFTFILSLYMSFTYEDMMIKFLNLIKDVGKRKEINEVVKLINKKIGLWIQGQMILSTVIFLCSFLVLVILGIPLALPFALIAGILEVIPSLGPILSLILPLLVAIAIGGPFQYFGVFVGFQLIQLLENYVLVPKIMSTSVNLDPIAVLLSVFIGGYIFGPVGALLAVPIVAVVSIIIDYFLLQKK